MIRPALVSLVSLAALVPARTADAQAPSVALHELAFYVHVDTLGADPIADYQAAVDDALLDALLILQGEQGPADAPCCTELVATANVVPFGTPGDGYDVVHFTDDVAALSQIAQGPAVFIVDLLSECAGQAPTGAIGCAQQPGDVQVITLAALDLDVLGSTIAHERGHNAGLDHVTPNACDVMQPIAGGSCMPAADCTTYRNDATRIAAETCECLADATSKQADGTACSTAGGAGVCSGGVCGDASAEAGIVLVAAADPAGGVLFDDLVSGSGLTGDWQVQAAIGGGAIPNGLAYAPDRGVLYGVRTVGTDGALLEIDSETGSVTSSIALAGRPGLISLAYDPGGPGSGDDRLLAVERTAAAAPGDFWESVVAIDPDDGSAQVVCGNLLLSSAANGFFTGLAWDTAAGRLLGVGDGGLYEIDADLCSYDPIPHPGGATLSRGPGALAYSEDTGIVFMIGEQNGTLYTLVDTGSGDAISTSFGLDPMRLGGLAAIPIPEPATAALGAGALAALLALRRVTRRGCARPRPAPRA